MKRTSTFAAAAALALGLAAAGAFAQPYGYGPGYGMGPGYGAGHGHGWGRGFGPGPGAQGNPAAAVEARLAYLKTELKIASGQEAAWNAFAGATRQNAEAMQALRTAMQGSTAATAPERMELRTRFMKQRQEQMEKRTAAFKDLYAALTPEQKAIADQRFGGGFGPGMGRGHRGGPGRAFL